MKGFLKKVIGVICIMSLFCSMAIISSYAESDIHILLNGFELTYDVPPQIIDGYTMVPMRSIFETLGYSVMWNDYNQEVTAYNDNTDLIMRMFINEKYMFLGNMSEYKNTNYSDNYLESHLISIDKAPQIINGRTLVPLRIVSETSGMKVSWDAENKTVRIGKTDDDVRLPEASYYNAVNEINQIKQFINNGQYIEAINLCTDTKQNHILSAEDISNVDELSNEAQQKYNSYLDNKLNNLLTDENKKIMFDKCKRYISHSLKSPSTAIWPNYNDSNVYYNVFKQQHEIVVTFEYEAMNSFGGYVRSTAMYAFDENLRLQDIAGYKLVEY